MIVDQNSSKKVFKLIDFGLMEKRPIKNQDKLQVPEYQAPEIYFGYPYATKVDVWSLGVTIVEALLDHVAFGVACQDEEDDNILESQVVSHLIL